MDRLAAGIVIKIRLVCQPVKSASCHRQPGYLRGSGCIVTHRNQPCHRLLPFRENDLLPAVRLPNEFREMARRFFQCYLICHLCSLLGLLYHKAGTDAQIDRLVYDLYGLTEAEIKIVEGAG